MKLSRYFLYLSIYYVTLLLSACNSGFESSRVESVHLTSIQGGVFIPKTDKIDSDCKASSNYDACLFFKSPTHQLGQTFSSKDKEILNSQNIFGVKISGIDSSGKLKNSHFSIETINSQPVNTLQLNSYKLNSENSSLNQLMAFYWMNRAFEYFEEQVGGLALKNKGLKVIVDDDSSGFRSSTNSIHLSRGTSQLPMALDASVVLHYMGQANFYWATQGGIQDFSQDQSHVLCAGDPKGCCKSEVGCSRALLYGASDFFALSLFPDSPHIAETWSKSTQGQELCGVSRSLSSAQNLTFKLAYDSCFEDKRGHAHLMGLVYASIWWEVRQQIVSLNTGEVPYLDQLFFLHLKDLKGYSDFEHALQSILRVDREKFQSRFSRLFQDEFSRRRR